ncbi:MAG: aminoacetone oxidase family FAD-binding enzyme, partial [Bacteroidia bacterium]
TKENERFLLRFQSTLSSTSEIYIQEVDALVVTSGGFPKKEGYGFLKNAGHSITKPIPSLFTLNLPGDPIIKLMGVSVPLAKVKIASSGYMYEGPVLITHWGFSGPAVLKLSAFAAEYFFEKNYEATVLINWVNKNEEEVRDELSSFIVSNGKLNAFTQHLFHIPKRLWEYLLFRAEIPAQKPWAEVGKKHINKLISLLTNDEHRMQGKTTFKEEFVTCGGVPLDEVDFKTMESKLCKDLHFAGEVLNIDGITGGFNFQAAWSTAWIAANGI